VRVERGGGDVIPSLVFRDFGYLQSNLLWRKQVWLCNTLAVLLSDAKSL
jgi:hypothetical protein